MKRREFLRMAVGAFSLPALLGACAKAAKPRTLTFFNWSDYIGKKTLPQFEEETGIHVNMDLFSDEEEMFAKIKTGVQGYDLIVVTDYMVPRFRTLGLAEPMPTDRLKNLENLSPRFRHPPYDPELRLCIPYLWGTTGIAYNTKYISRKPDSWHALWDAQFQGKMSMLDNARDGIGVALLLLGLPTDTGDAAH